MTSTAPGLDDFQRAKAAAEARRKTPEYIQQQADKAAADELKAAEEALGDPDWGPDGEVYTGESQGTPEHHTDQSESPPSTEDTKKPDRLQKFRESLKPWRGDIPPKPVFASEYLACGIGRPSLIVAPPGTGKSWLALALAMSVASGTPFGELDVAKPSRSVLWLDYEQGDYEMHRREALLSLGCSVPPSEVSMFTSLSNPPSLKDKAFQKFLEGYLAENKTALVVVDTLTSAWSIENRNESAAADPLIFMSKLSEATGACFVVVYHTRKMRAEEGGGGDQEMVLGSQSIIGAVQSIWLGKETGQNRMTLKHVKCNNAPKSDPFSFGFEFDRETGGIRFDASRISKASGEPETKEELAARRFTEAEMKIMPLAIELLGKRPEGISTRQLEATLCGSGRGAATIRNVLERMAFARKIHRAPRTGKGGGAVYKLGAAPQGSESEPNPDANNEPQPEDES